MPAPAVLRIDKPNQVYERLRSMIIRGRLAPGARVVENDMAVRLGVSRTPAREAIQRLFQEGFLVAKGETRRTELVVAPLTREDMWDLYRIMASLEGAAARGVDELDAATQRELARELRDIEADFERTAREKKADYDRLFELHNLFHDRLVRVCGRPRIRAMIETVRPQVDRYEWVYAPLVGPDYTETFAEHADIIKAVRDGSGRRAQNAVVVNWERGAERLGRAIGNAGGRGDW
jgi:DNA-binding GntR family transcriptional regulator